MNSPITRSGMRSVLEKHSVRRTNRLIRVRIDVLALDFLRILLAYVMLLDIDMPLIGPPSVSVILGDAKGLSQLLQPQEDLVLPPPKHIRSHLPGVVINSVPEPSRMRFRLHKTPHFIELRAQSTTHLQLIRAPDFHLDLLGMQERPVDVRSPNHDPLQLYVVWFANQ